MKEITVFVDFDVNDQTVLSRLTHQLRAVVQFCASIAFISTFFPTGILIQFTNMCDFYTDF